MQPEALTVPNEIAQGPWDRCWPHLAIPLPRDQHNEVCVALLTLALRHERAAWELRFKRPLRARSEHAASFVFGWLAGYVQVAEEPVLRIYPRDLNSWSEAAEHLGWQWLESAIERFPRLWGNEIARVKAKHGQDAWPWSRERSDESPSYASYRLTDLPE